MKFIEILAQVRSILSKGAGADIAFGRATQVNDLTVIPVARISMAFGGGSGSSPASKKAANPKDSPAEEPQADQTGEPKPVHEGGGGGGQVKTTPVGIYTIKDDKVKFYPLIGFREMLMVLGMLSLLIIKLRKLKPSKRK